MYEVEEKQNEKLALEAAAAADKQERLAITDGSSSSSSAKVFAEWCYFMNSIFLI